ncbi:BT1926 family outer membrane beta-barrel protein [Adhaeribacter pallidiroseus]|uniref:Outer membrane protein beta-barrel domain-containing protein n=1 Tax=Adhaeribacter pallidiroseus TaxID=2072847 RepID=A0A369Q614_9BACT|nr:BT1926 family outer membrane beta-barrel protein [Adhaeribacter pallidiroseus]RDC58737.1 hypothetical protein AHMF7616_05371 [Adhaeribacter pallidiroseus]
MSATTGIEKHFSGTKKLSPYIGAEIGFTSTFVKSEYTGPDREISVKNGYIDDNQNPNGRPGYSQIGLNAIVGADYYFVKRFYVGMELGYGIQYKISKKIEIKENGITTYADKVNGFRQFALGAYANPGLRVGFVF